jgi:hypothetical protein
MTSVSNNRYIRTCIIVAACVITAFNPLEALALTPADYGSQSIDFYSANATACQATSVSGDAGTGGNADYKGRKIVNDDQMAKIKANQPTYEKAAAETKIPWQLLAVVHLRESGLAKSNPNGDGIYQILSKNYAVGPISDAQFLTESIDAGNFLKNISGSKKDQLAAGDPDAVKDVLFGYNGRAAAYTRQAKALGFENGYEGSPYVMNIADAKRDPEVNKTTWGQIKTDGGGLSYPTNSDYGAFVVYAALAGIASSSGACAGTGAVDPRVGQNGWEVTGTNAMVVYYQYKAPWATQTYGGGTIKECGCGPTSMAMIVATLRKDSSVTPKVMADFFANNNAQEGGCASNWSLFTSSSVLAKKYGLEIVNLGTDLSKAGPATKKGSLVLMSQGEGMFTSSGHIMVIRGITPSGNYLVADPYGEGNTTNETGFTSGQIKAALKNLWEVRLKDGGA